MYVQLGKSKEKRSRAVVNSVVQRKRNGKQSFGFVSSSTKLTTNAKNCQSSKNINERKVRLNRLGYLSHAHLKRTENPKTIHGVTVQLSSGESALVNLQKQTNKENIIVELKKLIEDNKNPKVGDQLKISVKGDAYIEMLMAVINGDYVDIRTRCIENLRWAHYGKYSNHIFNIILEWATIRRASWGKPILDDNNRPTRTSYDIIDYTKLKPMVRKNFALMVQVVEVLKSIPDNIRLADDDNLKKILALQEQINAIVKLLVRKNRNNKIFNENLDKYLAFGIITATTSGYEYTDTIMKGVITSKKLIEILAPIVKIGWSVVEMAMTMPLEWFFKKDVFDIVIEEAKLLCNEVNTKVNKILGSNIVTNSKDIDGYKSGLKTLSERIKRLEEQGNGQNQCKPKKIESTGYMKNLKPSENLDP